jgi:hypothetical protein
MMTQLVGQNTARAQVVAIAEAPRDAEYLVIARNVRRLEPAIDVHSLGPRSSSLKSVSGFLIAISAGGAQHKNAWNHRNDYEKPIGRIDQVRVPANAQSRY